MEKEGPQGGRRCEEFSLRANTQPCTQLSKTKAPQDAQMCTGCCAQQLLSSTDSSWSKFWASKNPPVPLMATGTCGFCFPSHPCVLLHWGQGRCPGRFLEPSVRSRLGRLQQDWRQPSWRHLSSWVAVKLKHCCAKQWGCVCWRHFGEISERCLLSLVAEQPLCFNDTCVQRPQLLSSVSH